MKNKKKRESNIFLYRVAQTLSAIIARVIFRRRFLRNELKGKKGPIVVIANHEAALDFTLLIGATSAPMNFVISESFYQTMPRIVRGTMKRIGIIPKQQFQTSLADIKRMKSTVDNGGILAIYPAGLMCEDGVSTPIPETTYKFLQWLKADVYVAKTTGSYFVSPKWSKKKRPGRTYIDVFKLFDKEELMQMTPEQVKEKTDRALIFDAYREQESLHIKYKDADNLEGLENVLYMCPHCHSEFTIKVRDKSVIFCSHCGYELECDKYGFLHNRRGIGQTMRYVSDWSRMIYENLKARVQAASLRKITAKTAIYMIDKKHGKFIEVGEGAVCIQQDRFALSGVICGEKTEVHIPTDCFASLPFSPGKYVELQHGNSIYRCMFKDGRLVMPFVNMVKIFYEMNCKARTA